MACRPSAQVDGARPRTTVILEFHPLGKIPRMRPVTKMSAALPCPSQWHKAYGYRGRPGYPLYPQDVA